jgi:ParB family chromosome partitioning protein
MVSSHKHSSAITRPARIKFDAQSGFKSLVDSAQTAADNRFSNAAHILQSQPSALAIPTEQEIPLARSTGRTSADFDLQSCQIGQVYSIPLALIDPNPVGVRHFYRMDNVEAIVESMEDGKQDVAVNGFVKDNRVELIDGGTRLKAARAAGFGALDVKIEPPPKDLREQYKRSSQLNDLRSDHTALDMAINMRRLIEQGVYASQDEMAADMLDRKGKPLLKSQVSNYMRIARIPERLLQKMSEADQTSAFTIAYEISALFVSPAYEADQERMDLIAIEIIDDVRTKQLSKTQTQALVAAKIKGPKSRQSAVSSVVRFGNQNGKIKVFPSRGQVQFTIDGLNQEQVEEVRERIEKALAGPPTL